MRTKVNTEPLEATMMQMRTSALAVMTTEMGEGQVAIKMIVLGDRETAGSEGMSVKMTKMMAGGTGAADGWVSSRMMTVGKGKGGDDLPVETPGIEGGALKALIDTEEKMETGTGRARRKIAAASIGRTKRIVKIARTGKIARKIEIGMATTRIKEVNLDADLTPEEIQMMQAMGIPFAFDTTQGKEVEDEFANVSAIKISTTRSARQYMNRRGGFNRPLPTEKTGEKVARD
eukprot:gene25922-11598_t